MTQIGKILAVFLFFASVLFLGVTSAVVATSVPWLSYTEDMTDYTWKSEGEGESFRWTVAKRRSGDPAAPVGQTIKSSKVLPDVIIAARKQQIQDQQQKIQQLEQEIPRNEGYVQALKSAIEADLKAMELHAGVLTQQLAKIREDLKTISDENIQMSEQIALVRAQEIARRKDVTRLKALYDVVLTEKARLESQRETLQDTLNRLNGTLEALERRNGQLRHQMGLPPREAAETSPASEES